MKAINVVCATTKTRNLLRILAAGILAAACVSGQTQPDATGALAITTSSLPNGVLSQPYGSVTVSATGGSGAYSWSATGTPAGMTMSTAGVLGGTPTAAGTFSVTVSVTSGAVNASAMLLLAILPRALPLQIPGGGGTTQLTLTGGTVSAPYSQTLPASNGNPPYSWSVAGGALPEGLSLSAAGTLSGTPNQAGSYLFTGRVTDTSGATASSVFLVAFAPQTFTFTSVSSLPNGIVGSDYPAQILTVAGGNAPYTFQITGGLPGGLTLSAGEISGIPTTSGNFTFTVTTADSSSPALTASAQFHLTIQGTRTDLTLSLASLAFSLNSGATGVPSGAGVSVRSSVAAQLLNYSLAVSPAASWLTVTGAGTTPGNVGINLTPQALSLAAGVYQTSIMVTCVSPSPCSGNTQTINVSLNVTAAAPQMAVTSSLLSFSAQTSNPQPVSQTLGLQNVGGGTITVNSVTALNSFVTISGVPATVSAGPVVAVTVTVNPTGLSAGYYQSTVLVNTSAGSVSVPVTLFVAQNGTMTLNPAGIELEAAAGSSPGNASGSFLVGISGNSAAPWTATLLSGASWLTLNTSSGSSTSANPGVVSFSINATAASLAPGAYYGMIQITSNSVVDSPQIFTVVLNVAPAGSPVPPDPAPEGLVFIPNGSAPPAQAVQVFVGSSASVNYQASSDSSWLQVTPPAGTTSASSPASSSVSVNVSGLGAGIYRGNVSYALSSAVVRTVNVTLIVAAGSGLPGAPCAPSHLVPTQTGLVNNFAQPASWPAQLAVTLLNDCGQPVTNGQILATFSNGDSALPLNAANTTSGIYVGTWTPRNASGQVAIVATASAPGFPAATAQIVGQVTPNAAPLLYLNGTLDAFAIGPEVGAPVAPGTIVQIYGSNLAAQLTTNSTVPLPTNLGQTSVYIGGMLAPLYFVSPGQINAQVPFELPAGQTSQVIVSANGALSTPIPLQLANDAPGIAQFPAGQVIATHTDGVSLILETSPAAPNEVIVLYLLGMGLTDQNVPSGTASPSTSLAHALDKPTLTLNAIPVNNIPFAGLTPTAVGLYQVNFQVPANAPDGDLQLVVTQTSGQSNSAILPVHNSNVPSLTCPAVSSGEVGVALKSPAMSVSGGIAPFIFSLASGILPAGLTLNTSTGAITGTPTAAGTFFIQVKDANGFVAVSSCPFTIAVATSLTCPAVSTFPVGVAVKSPAMVVSGSSAPYTFSVANGTLPAGLTLNTSTGAITGTPTAQGTFTIQVTDANGFVAASSCPFTVLATSPPSLTCPAVRSGEVGVAFNSPAMTVSGGTAPYTFSLSSGTLPAGLTLNASTGAIAGTPTAAGIFTVQVKDANGFLAATFCPFTIAAKPSLTCPAVSSGTVGVAFNSPAMSVSGGTAPYTFSLASGSLPSGLTLNTSTGAITGAPAAAGTFTIQMTDANGIVAASTCPFTIAGAAQGLLAVQSVTVGQGLEVPVTVTFSPATTVGATQCTSSATPNCLTITSSSSSVLVGGSGIGGSLQILTPIPAGTSSVSFYAQASGSPGATATLTVSAPGYTNGTGVATIANSGFVISGPNGIGGAFTTFQAVPTALTVSAARLDSNNSFVEEEAVMGGSSINVLIASSPASIGTVSPSSLTFTGGTSSGPVTFQASGANTGGATITLTEPSGFTLPAVGGTLNVTVQQSSLIPPSGVTLGQNLQVPVVVSLNGNAPANTTVTLTSANASLLQFACITNTGCSTGAGNPPTSVTLTVQIPQKQTQSANFYVIGYGSTGSAGYSISAPNYPTVQATIPLAPSGLVVQAVSATLGGASPQVTVSTAALVNGAPVPEAVATNQTVTATVTSSPTSVGTITNPTVTISGGSFSGATFFQPVAAGTATITATATGFTSGSVQETVTAASLNIGNNQATVGQHLENQNSLLLSSPAPNGGLQVTLSVDPGSVGLMQLAVNATDPGSNTIMLTVPSGFNTATYFVYGLASSGTATYSASAPGYGSGTDTVTLAPSGIVIPGPSSVNVSLSGGPQAFTVGTALLDGTNSPQILQSLAGQTPLTVTIGNSNSAAGTLPSSVSIAPGTDSSQITFVPASQGSTTISVVQPTGYTMPNRLTSVAITVGP